MKYFYLISFASLIILSACKKEVITGSGSVITEQRSLNNFTSINASDNTVVVVRKGNQFSIEVTEFENLVPYFETSVTNGVLNLRWKSNLRVEGSTLTVYVTLPMLTGVATSGSSAIVVEGKFSGSYMEVTCSGNGTIHIFDDQTENFFATISGNGKLEGFGMTSKKADLNVSGNGKAELTCTDELRVKISGTGIVYYKGNPTISSQISGGGILLRR